MKKQDLIDKVAELSGKPKVLVREVLDAAADATRQALSRREEVFLFGVGKLSVSARGAKKARNIHTGEPVTVPPRNVVLFRPSDSVVDAANNGAAA